VNMTISEIQVITSDLYSGSNTLNAAAVDLGKVQVQLGEIIDAAGDAYDGQLRQALEDIIGPGVYAGGRLQNRAGELGRELSDRAMGFEEANVAGQSATLNASTAYINYVESTPTLGFISIIKNKLQSIGQSIWNVAGLTLGGLMSRFFLKAKPSIPSSFDSTPQPKPTPSTSTILVNPTQTMYPKKNLDYGESVTADDNRRTWEEKQTTGVSDLGLYTRFDDSGGKSNCTWYAAAAVEMAYGIPLNSGIRRKSGTFSRSLGNGGQWAEHAEDAMNNPNSKYKEYRPYIKAVNRIPEPGSVYSIGSQNHVAFVENVSMIENNGKRQIVITISEENYLHKGSQTFSGSTRIILLNNPDVYRWRRDLHFDIDPHTGEALTDGKFIHFKNPN
jgi:hypothetical protein